MRVVRVQRLFVQALEIIPYTLAENAGMNPIAIVTELRKQHAEGKRTAGINVKKGMIRCALRVRWLPCARPRSSRLRG